MLYVSLYSEGPFVKCAVLVCCTLRIFLKEAIFVMYSSGILYVSGGSCCFRGAIFDMRSTGMPYVSHYLRGGLVIFHLTI